MSMRSRKFRPSRSIFQMTRGRIVWFDEDVDGGRVAHFQVTSTYVVLRFSMVALSNPSPTEK